MKSVKYLLIFTFIIALKSNFLFAIVEVDINNDGDFEPIPITIPYFISNDKTRSVADKLYEVVNNDLTASGQFNLSQKSLLSIKDVNLTTDIKTTGYVTSRFKDTAGTIITQVDYDEAKKEVKIKFIIWDNYNNMPLASYGYDINIDELNDREITKIGHDFADEIYYSFLGERSYFKSKIAFISNNTLYISDYDGSNKEEIYKSNYDIYTPKFSNDGRYIAYISFKDQISQIYLYDFVQKKNIKLGNFNNIITSPRFSNNNKYMLFAVSKNGSTNIFELNLESKKINQITKTSYINIPGGYSPDDNKIIFISDRAGKTDIYTMDRGGKNVEKISKGAGMYYTPSWAAFSNKIVFNKIENNIFKIGTMNVDGLNEKILSSDDFAESPSWANNGRNVIYSFRYDKRNAKHALYIINLNNKYKLLVRPANDAIDPVFSYALEWDKIIANKHGL